MAHRLHKDGVPLRMYDLVETHFGEWLDSDDLHGIYEDIWGRIPLDTVQHAMRRLQSLCLDLEIETREEHGVLELRMDSRSYFDVA